MRTHLQSAALAAVLACGPAMAQSPSDALTGYESAARADGRHVVTGKALAPLAPAGNAARFADPARTEKWFRRNCNDVLGRECTAAEKGNVLAWLVSLRP